MRKAWSKALNQAGIEDFVFHDLRHTVGTRLIENGADIRTVQDIFGHSTVAVTERYLHTDVNRKKKAMEVLNSYN